MSTLRREELESSEDEKETEIEPTAQKLEILGHVNVDDAVPRILQREERNSHEGIPSISSLQSPEVPRATSGLPNTRFATMPVADSEENYIPMPRIDVQDDDEGYIFDRPNRTRVLADSDDEDRGENPLKRRRIQGPDELSSYYPNKSSAQIHIKHSGGRRTFGLSRGR
jgi:hypothetical protein